MDPNSLQRLPGMVYMQKLEQAAQQETPFAQFDALTPDEPIWAWQLVKRLLQRPSKIRRSQVPQSSSPNFATQFQQSDR